MVAKSTLCEEIYYDEDEEKWFFKDSDIPVDYIASIKSFNEIINKLYEINTSLENLSDISYNIAILAMIMRDIKQMQECKML